MKKVRVNQHRHNGAIILTKIEDGDCVRFSSVGAILKDLKIYDNNYRSIDKLKTHQKFKDKYIFFAMERDLLSW